MLGEAQDKSKSNSERRQFVPFTADEVKDIQTRLDASIDADSIQFRPSAQGSVAYVEGWRALSLANEVFGFNGWSSEILSLSVDFCDNEGGRISLGISCMIRIYLKDGTFHDDIGYGSAENQKSKVAAYEKARKEAVTDAMKRCLRIFGYRLGNCAYDKSFLRQVRNGTKSHPQPPVGNHTNIPQPIQPLHSGRVPPQPTIQAVNLTSNAPPPDFIPAWQHPKAATTLTEPDSEPLMTEERILTFLNINLIEILEMGSFFADEIDAGPPSVRLKLNHTPYRSPRAEFNGSRPMTAVSMPIAQFRPSRPPHPQ
jgi:DNA recombination protein Rad52